MPYSSADRVRALLGQMHLDAERAAQALGVDGVKVRSWCSGRAEPSRTEWLALERLATLPRAFRSAA
jgi:DNA-binding transcriptional regulator YiaG